ncbi:MAG: SDR family oxidoreductase [Myxococcales bacterium FL481]|nr:MAG: SDR family oxidoreductase [Myxococcales bacterium FL481]
MAESTAALALITGGNSGIGKWTAIGLARRGFQVVITSRDPARGQSAVAEIRREAGSDAVECLSLDLADCAAINDFARVFSDRFTRLDVLVNNAGLMLSDRSETVDGFETTFGVNHLGHFLLTHRLLPVLRRSAPARIVVVASDAHKSARKGLDFADLQSTRRYSGFEVYARSKLANIYFARELARQLDPEKITVNALHPGVVATNFSGDGDARGLVALFFRLARPFLLTAEQGASTSVCLCTAPDLAGKTGGYFAKSKPAALAAAAHDDTAARRLWEASEQLLAAAGQPTA